MHVKLVSISVPTLLDAGSVTSAEDLIVYMARVSSPQNQGNMDTAPKLLRFLIKNKHWSPFDMVNMVVEVKTSKAVAIQILRHWSIKPQEFSQRYAEVTEIEPIHFRKSGVTNRQSSEDRFDPILSEELVPAYLSEFTNGNHRASVLVDSLMGMVQDTYKALLHAGVAKECARMILPMASSTTMYLNGSVRSWVHYLQQRTDQHAQLEHREVASEVKRLFIDQFPNVAKALEDE